MRNFSQISIRICDKTRFLKDPLFCVKSDFPPVYPSIFVIFASPNRPFANWGRKPASILYKHLKKSNAACFYTPVVLKLLITVQM